LFQTFFIVHFIYGMSSFPLTNSFIFFKMVKSPPTRYIFHSWLWNMLIALIHIDIYIYISHLHFNSWLFVSNIFQYILILIYNQYIYILIHISHIYVSSFIVPYVLPWGKPRFNRAADTSDIPRPL
jgi:hypothetical protein